MLARRLPKPTFPRRRPGRAQRHEVHQRSLRRGHGLRCNERRAALRFSAIHPELRRCCAVPFRLLPGPERVENASRPDGSEHEECDCGGRVLGTARVGG